MILLLLLNLSISSLFGLPATLGNPPSEPACDALRTVADSLSGARIYGSLCADSMPKCKYYYFISAFWRFTILLYHLNVQLQAWRYWRSVSMVSTLIRTALIGCTRYAISMYNCRSLSNSHFQNLTEVSMDDQDCFCGGLVKFSDMLTSVKALLCLEEDEVRAGMGSFFWPETKTKPSTTTQSSTSSSSMYINIKKIP